MAQRLGLPDDWLNDAVKGFVPGTDPQAVPIFRRPGLEVAAASARFLLGMRTPAEVLAVVTSLYPDRLLTRTRFLVEELFTDGPP